MSKSPSSDLKLQPVVELTISDLINEVRGEMGISQRDLATRLGLSEDQLYRRKKQEVRMPHTLTSKLRMMLMQARQARSQVPEVSVDKSVQSGSVTIISRDPVIAAAAAAMRKPVEPAGEQFQIEMSSIDCAMQELEAAIVGGKLGRSGKSTPASSSGLEQLFDTVSQDYPLTTATLSGADFPAFCQDLKDFGLYLPETCDGLSRAARHQVETVFREYLRSMEACLEWIDEILGQCAPEAVVGMIASLRANIKPLAIARMDLHSIYEDNVDRSRFDARAVEVKKAALPRLKALLDGHVEAGAPIMRNPYRLVEATNDQLSMEVRNGRGEDRFKVQDSFPLPYRMIMNELVAIRREVEDLRSIRQRNATA